VASTNPASTRFRARGRRARPPRSGGRRRERAPSPGRRAPPGSCARRPVPHVEELAKAPARSAVVGHRHDGRDRRRIAASCPQRGRRAVTAADGNHRDAVTAGHQRSMSRWKTVVATPCSASRRRGPRRGRPSGAGPRCSPWRCEIRLAFADEGRHGHTQEIIDLLQELHRLGLAEHVVAHRRVEPALGRSSSTQ